MANVNPAKRARLANDFQKWERPALTCLDKPCLELMQVDIDYYSEAPNPQFWGPSAESKVPVVRMYGVTIEGNSVLAHIHGFMPYFWVQCPDDMVDTEVFKASLEQQLQDSGNRDKLNNNVLKVEIASKSTLMYYQAEGLKPFFRVTVALPALVSTSRSIIERGFQLTSNQFFQATTSYETNIPFVLRFMVDRHIVGGGWVKLENFQVRGKDKCKGACQVEVDVNYESVEAIDLLKLAPLRIFSFDIECYNQEGKGFPQAQKNPVIQIAVYIKELGKSEKLFHGIWNLNTCSEIAEAEVYTFDKEADMLISFRDFIERTDPDIITGYNILNFDLPYLLDRAEALQLTNFCKLGRMCDRTRVRVNDFGGREVKEVNIEGRVQFDMMVVIQKEYKLRSYSLNAVSAEYLGDQKEDVHYSMIGELFKTSADTRRRLAIYCLKDASLPMQLMDKLLCMFNYVEMARVTGTPINYLLNRGQMIKVTSQLLRKAQQHNFLMPTLKSEKSDDKYEGATVLDPICGYYEKPIATLDFASLYPSIMMAHNLCYCTLVKPEHVPGMKSEEMTNSVAGSSK